jgi:hypothetical protein
MHIRYHLMKWIENTSLVIHWEMTAHHKHFMPDNILSEYNTSFLI